MTASIRLFDPDQFAHWPVKSIVTGFLLHAREDGRYGAEALVEHERVLTDFAEFIGAKPIADCSIEDLQDWVALHRRWKAPSTRRSKCSQVSASFTWGCAARRKECPLNPFLGFGAIYGESEPRRPMTEPEFVALREASEPGFRHFLTFLWLTGARSGEARSITWEDIDWVKCIIVLRKHKSKKKTGKPRVIVLVPEAVELLRAIQADPGASRCLFAVGHVFRNQWGRPWRKETLCNKIRRLREKLNLPQGVMLHGIRHAFGTRHVKKSDGNIKMVSLAMGHSSVSVTERYYLHLDNEVEAMRAAIGGGTPSDGKLP